MKRHAACWLTLTVAISVLLLGQTGTVEQAFPLLFHGGTINAAGDIRWESLLYAANSGSSSGEATITFLKADGSPQLISLNGGPAQSRHTLSIPEGQARIFRMTSAYPQINVFWGLAQVGPGVRLTGDFRLFGTHGMVNDAFLSFARQIGSAAFKSREMTLSPVLLSPVAGFTQREMVLAVSNPGQSAANVTATLFDNEHVTQGAVSFTVPPGGQVYRLLSIDIQRTLEGGRIEIVSSQDVYAAALQFLNQFFSVIEAANGIYRPSIPSMLSVDTPADGQAFEISDIPVSGWRFKKIPAGTANPALPAVRLYLDGLLQNVTVTDMARADVVSAFTQYAVPANCGFSATLSNVANGSHVLKVQVTDDAGQVTEASRKFTVSKSIVVLPVSGSYFGYSNPELTTPKEASAEFWLTVEARSVTYLAYRMFIPSCGYSTGKTALIRSAGLSTVTIQNGMFSIGPSDCDYLQGEFLSSSKIRISYRRENAPGCWEPGFESCPVAIFVSDNVNKQ